MAEARQTSTSSNGLSAPDEQAAGAAAGGASSSSRASMKQFNTFPFRLHDMLDCSEREGTEHIVSWIPGNDAAFKVHHPNEFVSTIMPRFFQQTKYKSFQRQCNLWGFERLLHGNEKGGYCHPDGFFFKGNRELVNKMVRRKIKRRPSVAGGDATVVEPHVGMMTTNGQVAPQRRPSLVSCGSNSSSQNIACAAVDIFGQPPLILPSQYQDQQPQSPSLYYPNSQASSLTTSPMVSEGLYLPPPPSAPASTHSAQAPQVAEAEQPDALFMEGLSAFFEDGEISIVSEESASASAAVAAAPAPPLATQDAASCSQVPSSHRLEPKRRLSLELFVASRQPDSQELIMDLVSGSDALQKSLEMELMCEVAPPPVVE